MCFMNERQKKFIHNDEFRAHLRFSRWFCYDLEFQHMLLFDKTMAFKNKIMSSFAPETAKHEVSTLQKCIVTSVPLRCAFAHYHQTICEVKSCSSVLQHSKSHILYISHRTFTAWHASLVVCTWWRNCMRTETNICSVQNFLWGNPDCYLFTCLWCTLRTKFLYDASLRSRLCHIFVSVRWVFTELVATACRILSFFIQFHQQTEAEVYPTRDYFYKLKAKKYWEK